MGMSASQARYLGLTARKSNIEYQGQLINQERTILSQQCTALYNTLLDLQVPTPPSTSDFTKVVYTGADGATNFELGNIVPHQGGTYSIDFKYQTTGHYLNEGGQAAVTSAPKLRMTELQNPQSIVNANLFSYYDAPSSPEAAGSTPSTPGNAIMVTQGVGGSGYTGPNTDCYKLENGKFIQIPDGTDLTTSDYQGVTIYQKQTVPNPAVPVAPVYYDLGISATEGPKVGGGMSKGVIMNTFYVLDGQEYRTLSNSDFGESGTPFERLTDGTYRLNPNASIRLSNKADAEVVDSHESGTDIFEPELADGVIGVVAGKECYRLKDAVNKGLISDTSLSEYIQAIRNAFPVYADPEEYSDLDIQDMFAVYCTNDSSSGRLVPHFVLTEEVMNHIGDQNDMHYVTTYDYNSSGRYTEIETKKDCMLVFDAQGRITQVKVPNYDENGNITTYKTIDLSAEQQTDNDAYNDAFNKYEYQQYLYDKKQQEINRKTEIIQQEDRSLELKLTRLDNERKAVDTELEAVKKVIQDNIDKSFKTFSG